MMITTKMARTLQRHGALQYAQLERTPLGDRWCVIFGTQEGPEGLQTDRGKLREFAKIQTAIKITEALGFKIDALRVTNAVVGQ